jgi:hypothetical protein
MPDLPPNVSMRDLLDQTVSKMATAISDDALQDPRPWDCAFMSFLTANARPNQFMLVLGENYLDEVQKYAYYYATKLRKKCWLLSCESTPMLNVLSMLALASGIGRRDLLSLTIPAPCFAALNDALETLYKADCKFSIAPPRDLASIVCLAKTLKKQEGVEVLFVDALHRIEFEPGKPSSPTEQRWISQVLTAVAHAGELTIVAGCDRPDEQFPDLAADSEYYCEPMHQR